MESEKTIQTLETKNTNLYKRFSTVKRANNRLKNENKELKKKQVFVFRAPTSP